MREKGAVKNGKSRETGNIGYSRKKTSNTKQYNIICVGHHYGKTNSKNVNKTPLQTSEGKHEPIILIDMKCVVVWFVLLNL